MKKFMVETPPSPSNEQMLQLAHRAIAWMTVGQVCSELKIAEEQIEPLKRVGGFPNFWYQAGTFMYKRTEVERWIAAQPDQKNLAAAL